MWSCFAAGGKQTRRKDGLETPGDPGDPERLRLINLLRPVLPSPPVFEVPPGLFLSLADDLDGARA
jgi:hypothetical protein